MCYQATQLLGTTQLLNKSLRSIRFFATSTRDADTSMSTSPIEFTSNLVFEKSRLDSIADKASMALRCTDDTTDAPNLPFNVKRVDHVSRKNAKAVPGKMTVASIRKNVIDPYLQLTKPRLTTLVMLSAICSYALSPYPATLMQLTCLTIGTTFCSGAANAINMGREPDYDRMMTRTSTRPVVRGIITPKQSFEFAAVIGTVGTSVLYFGVNPTVAALGASNIVLYSWIYTSLKRKTILNTWVGALVGAIPPLMGWAAASSLTHPGAWVLAVLLYAWQFPHFNSLSHNVRNEYKNAGYVMTAWKNPKLNARVGLRYTLLMFPLCFALSYFDITDWYYQIDSAIVNAWLSFWAFKFYWQQRLNYSKDVINDKEKLNKGLAKSNVFARKMMLSSVLQLPAILLLAIFHKKGRWDWLFNNDNKKLK